MLYWDTASYWYFLSKGKMYYQEFQTPRPNGTIVPTPMFVISFDAIVADAECRNHTFLEILRHGMKKHAEITEAAPSFAEEIDANLSSKKQQRKIEEEQK